MPLEIIPFIFIFALKIKFSNEFFVKMIIRDTTSIDFDLDKCYPGHDLKQYSRGFSCSSDILRNVNAGGNVTFKKRT